MEPRFEADGSFRDSQGRLWSVETVQAHRLDRSFYTGDGLTTRFGFRRTGYLQLLHDLAACYDRIGWAESAENTRRDARDIEIVLGIVKLGESGGKVP